MKQFKKIASAAIISGLLAPQVSAAYFDNGTENFLTAQSIGSLGTAYTSGVDVTKLEVKDYISNGRVDGSWRWDKRDIFKFDAEFSHPDARLARRNVIPIRVRLSTSMQINREVYGIKSIELIEKHPSGAFKKLARLVPNVTYPSAAFEFKTAIKDKDLGFEYYLVIDGLENDDNRGKQYNVEIERFDIGNQIAQAADLGVLGNSMLFDDNTIWAAETINSLVNTDNWLDFGSYLDDADLYKAVLPAGEVKANVGVHQHYVLNDTLTLELLKEDHGQLVSIAGPFNAARYQEITLATLTEAGEYYIRVGFNRNTTTVYDYSLRVKSSAKSEDQATKLAVSNPLENGCGVNSAQHCFNSPLDNGLPDSGAVYLYQYYNELDQWLAQEYIKSPNPEAGDNFGEAAFFTENDQFLAVAAPGEDNCGAGFDGTAATAACGYYAPGMANNDAENSGALYIFNKEEKVNAYGFGLGVNETYQLKNYVKAPVVHSGDNFGAALSTGNQIALVGAPGLSSQTDSPSGWLTETDINQQLDDVSYTHTGSVFLYELNASADWTLAGAFRPLKLQNNQGGFSIEGENFGAGITNSGDGNIIAISAPGDARCDNSPLSENGVYNLNNISKSNFETYLDGVYQCTSVQSGSVWIYQKDDQGDYQVISYLKAPQTREADFFGEATWMTGDGEYLAVGAPGNDSGNAGSNGWSQKGDPLFATNPWNDTSKPNSGAVYLYKKQVLSGKLGYELIAYGKPELGMVEGSNFGATVFLNDDRTLIVGAPDGVYALNGQTFDNGYVRSFKLSESGQLTSSANIFPQNNANEHNHASRFGASLLMKNEMIFVGEPGDDHCGASVGGASLNVEKDYAVGGNETPCTINERVSNSGAVQIYNAVTHQHSEVLKPINPGGTYYSNEQFGGVLASNSSGDGASDASGVSADPFGDVLSEFLCSDEGGPVTGNQYFDWIIDSFVCGDD
ncbi:hypothetical protein [Thalassomonas haliotis]|uniref:Peptidase C-terminal archaeal/bacterial domain-containing protein n=1 Tax=Thalassomonas haliotis TaxID=485448 RepID=A0ABY7VHR7_9GAMM|nr:hypothetical protein [Thalassomonas haliotis]WDE12207.1 hypothetical protein H3N35_01595 [Thalassomonas haliotis]